MDETEYRTAYQGINPTRCVYEKAINSRVCNCSRAKRFNLADREGVSCLSPQAQKICVELLNGLREKARFVLQQTSIDGPLPHNAEIKIQNGGIKGLVKSLKDTNYDEQDIFQVISASIKKYHSLVQFPYSDIMQEIASYQGRRRSRKK